MPCPVDFIWDGAHRARLPKRLGFLGVAAAAALFLSHSLWHFPFLLYAAKTTLLCAAALWFVGFFLQWIGKLYD